VIHANVIRLAQFVAPMYVQDLSFWMPGAAIAAWLLWNRRPAGVVLVGAWLVWRVVESISVATDQWVGMLADPSVDATAAIVLFIVLALVGLVPLVAYFRTPLVPLVWIAAA
jgi:hypothetical protein